jgi:hypothetical protein
MSMVKEEEGEKLSRADLLRLHDHFADEIRTSLDFAHRNLSFYVGLLSALLAGVLAGLFQLHPGDRRVFGLLIGPVLVAWLAEVGYSTVAAFYHRFMDAYFTLVNVQQMLRLNDPSWVSSEVGDPYVRNKYGGLSQWVDPIDWLKKQDQLTVEAAKQVVLAEQLVRNRDILKNVLGKGKPPGFRAGTLLNARRTMWAFEVASVLLVPTILITGLS